MTGKGSSFPTNKHLTTLAVLVLLVAGVVFVGKETGYLTFSTTPSGAGLGTQSTSSGVCPDTGGTNMDYQVQYVDLSTTTPTDTPVNTSVAAYLGTGSKIATSALFSGTTGAAGYTTVGTANCGESVTSYVGDGGSTYYYAKVETTKDSTNAKETYILQKVKKSSAVTMSFKNSTSGNTGATVAQSGVGSGATSSDVTMYVKAGQYYYGDGAFEVCAQYDSTNISKVSFGASAIEIAQDKSLAVAAGTDTNCYEVSGDMYNYATKELPVVIQAASGVTPSNSSIKVYVNDRSARIKNGQLVDTYFNSDTKADLGRAAVSQAGAIVVN